MRVLDTTRHTQTPTVEIIVAAAHEMLISLCAFTAPRDEQATYEVGASWFERLDQRAPANLLRDVEQFSAGYYKLWSHLIGLVFDTPPPRDASAFLTHCSAVSAVDIKLHLLGYYQHALRGATSQAIISRAAGGDQDAQGEFLATSFPDDAAWQGALRRLLAHDAATTKRQLLSLLTRWQRDVFAEEAGLIVTTLQRDAEAKRQLTSSLTAEQLIEVATNGFRPVPEAGIRRIVLIPSFIMRPWVVVSEYGDAIVYAYPVAKESLEPLSGAPPAQLLSLCQALADERRLRILRHLAQRTLTLQEMADVLGVAKTTMHHHLAILRGAGLVTIETPGAKRYGLRTSAVASLSAQLEAFLVGPSG